MYFRQLMTYVYNVYVLDSTCYNYYIQTNLFIFNVFISYIQKEDSSLSVIWYI